MQQLGVVSAKGELLKHNATSSGRLFARHGLNTLPTREELIASGQKLINQGRVNWSAGGAVHKVPLLKCGRGIARRGSHNVSIQLCRDLLLPICHFKFTSDAFRRMEEAVSSGAWNHGSQKYKRYVKLLQIMKASGESFTDKNSVRYSSPCDLEDTGHLVVGERFAQ